MADMDVDVAAGTPAPPEAPWTEVGSDGRAIRTLAANPAAPAAAAAAPAAAAPAPDRGHGPPRRSDDAKESVPAASAAAAASAPPTAPQMRNPQAPPKQPAPVAAHLERARPGRQITRARVLITGIEREILPNRDAARDLAIEVLGAYLRAEDSLSDYWGGPMGDGTGIYIEGPDASPVIDRIAAGSAADRATLCNLLGADAKARRPLVSATTRRVYVKGIPKMLNAELVRAALAQHFYAHGAEPRDVAALHSKERPDVFLGSALVVFNTDAEANRALEAPVQVVYSSNGRRLPFKITITKSAAPRARAPRQPRPLRDAHAAAHAHAPNGLVPAPAAGQAPPPPAGEAGGDARAAPAAAGIAASAWPSLASGARAARPGPPADTNANAAPTRAPAAAHQAHAHPAAPINEDALYARLATRMSKSEEDAAYARLQERLERFTTELTKRFEASALSTVSAAMQHAEEGLLDRIYDRLRTDPDFAPRAAAAAAAAAPAPASAATEASLLKRISKHLDQKLKAISDRLNGDLRGALSQLTLDLTRQVSAAVENAAAGNTDEARPRKSRSRTRTPPHGHDQAMGPTTATPEPLQTTAAERKLTIARREPPALTTATSQPPTPAPVPTPTAAGTAATPPACAPHQEGAAMSPRIPERSRPRSRSRSRSRSRTPRASAPTSPQKTPTSLTRQRTAGTSTLARLQPASDPIAAGRRL